MQRNLACFYRSDNVVLMSIRESAGIEFSFLKKKKAFEGFKVLNLIYKILKYFGLSDVGSNVRINGFCTAGCRETLQTYKLKVGLLRQWIRKLSFLWSFTQSHQTYSKQCNCLIMCKR